MATIQKRGNSYQIKTSCGYSVEGKQIMQTMTWKPEPHWSESQIKKELNKAAVLFEQECDLGQVTSAMKFETFAERWFTEYAALSLKTRTISNYEQLTKRIYPAIGYMRLDKITPRHIQKFVLDLCNGERQDGREGKLSPKSVKLHIALISTIYEYGIKQQVVQFNPCKAVTLPRPNKKECEIYTIEEAQHLLGLFADEPTSNFKYVLFFNLAMYSGARRGELLGAEFSDFDFKNGTWEIKRASSWNKKRGVISDKPKTKASERCIKLPQNVLDMVLRFREYQNNLKAQLGSKWEEHDRLFTTWCGKPMHPNTPEAFFRRFCQRHEVRYVNIHGFRHFAATCMVFAGVDVKTVAGVLGHADAQTTMSLYLHSFQKAQVMAAESIATALNGGGKRE
jgi:integrase